MLRRNGSECSPRPYKLGLFGSLVLRRRYWVSKTMLAAEESKRTSAVLVRVMEKENGFDLYLNWILDLADLMPAFALGRGRTLSGTW